MGNDSEIKARLRKILEIKKCNVSKITEGEDIKRSTLSAQINGKSSVSASTISLFLRKFRDISAEWLTLGEGYMYCDRQKRDPNEPFMLGEPEPTPPEPNLRNRIDFLEQHLKLEQQKNELLQQQLNLYENRV